jgi:superfamily II DNA or RNA helicase
MVCISNFIIILGNKCCVFISTALASHTAAPLKLREYQLELAENAVLGRNTIICAETGSGKTWVALHIVQQHLQNARNGKKMILVIVFSFY